MNIEAYEGGLICDMEKVAFTYKMEDKVRDFDKYARSAGRTLEWNDKTNFIGKYLLHRYGDNNDLPSVIKDVVQRNYIGPGLLRKKTALLWGMGPTLYTEGIENGRRVRRWTQDAEVQAWLESWDYETYLQQACEDYQYMQGVFTKFELKKGYSVGDHFIKRLMFLQMDKVRLASLQESTTRVATHAIINDWSFSHPHSLTDFKAYPLFDYANPFGSPNSILYSNIYSFCSDYYSVPEIYGSLEWLNRSTAVPLIFKAMSKNSINLKYHITSPEAYWNSKRKLIRENCEKANKTYTESMLVEYQNEFLKKVGEVLSGDENAGKFLHTVTGLHVDGVNLTEFGWKIEVIDQKTKDFVESQIKISQRADHAVTAGIGLHSSLGNVSETGKSDSGSEQYYALIGFLNTGVDIPEMIICKALNYALKANFPKKGLKIGFYHNVPEKQEDISPSQRMINQK